MNEPPITPASHPLDIIAKTERYVVVNKPSGLLSVPGIGPEKADCVAARVRAHFPDATGPLTCHRLDMSTSGLLVLGLDPDAHRNLSMQFEARTVKKRYIALLEGHLPKNGQEPTSGTIDLPLIKDWENRPLQRVDHEIGKPSVTEWRLLANETHQDQPCCRVEFTPLTGRTHQLRLHAASDLGSGMGQPILGDHLYGSPERADRLMLHAAFLEFAEPGTGKRRAFNKEPEF